MERESMRSRRRPATEPWNREPAGGEWDRSPPPPADPARSRGKVGWGATLALLAVAMIVSGAATLVVMELWAADRVLPGVYVWDVDVGGLPGDEVKTRLSADFGYPADRYPVLRYGEQTWLVTPGDVGMVLDLEATTEAAQAVGHGGGLLRDLLEQATVLLSSRLMMPVFSFDPGTGRMFLSYVARQVNRPLLNSTLSLGEDLSVDIIPGQTGLEVDEEATYEALVQRMATMTGGEVALAVRESEPLLADLSAAQAEVQRVLSDPILLTAPDFEPWTIERAMLARWLILKPVTGVDGNVTLAVDLDPGQTTRFVEEIAAQVARPPVDARFRFDRDHATLVTVAESVAGRTLDVTSTVMLIERAASSDQRAVPLPVLSTRPAIATEDAPQLGIVELIGEGVTGFAGSSAARVQNIAVGATQFDGLLIPPGETFSFNHYLGEVTAEKGYEESIIIWGNTTRADVGGGLCQVSSTAFRAAFWAGLPIVERWPHAFRVGYYEPPVGMDATIYSPSVDLKWTNDTGHHILIHTEVDAANHTLTFRFYGTNPGRIVEMDGPYESNPVQHGPAVYREDPTLPKGETKQIEWAKDGLDVTVYRIIQENGVEVRRDTLFSRYRPWQAVYLVGTKED